MLRQGEVRGRGVFGAGSECVREHPEVGGPLRSKGLVGTGKGSWGGDGEALEQMSHNLSRDTYTPI